MNKTLPIHPHCFRYNKLTAKAAMRVRSALTPALSPRRGRPAKTRSEGSNDQHALSASLLFTTRRSNTKHAPTARKRAEFSPSPGGEGRGEGGRFSIQRLASLRVSFLILLTISLLTISVRAEDKLPIQPAADGSVLLHARDVIIHGKTVRYEPQTNKNTIGYWTKVEDWVSWDFEITKPGTFNVEILQGCGKGSGGSEVEFSVGEQILKVTVQDTGGFQNFVARDIGQLTFAKAGRYTLSVKPKTKPGVAVMDLRQVVLRPAQPDAGGKKTSKDKP